MKEEEVDDKSFEDIQKARLSFKVHQTYEAAARVRIAQAIEAKDNALEAKIEELRNNIRDNCLRFGRTKGSALDEDLETLERKVNQLQTEIKGLQNLALKVGGLDRKLFGVQHKVKELEKQLFHVTYGLEKERVDKPQPVRADEGSAEQPFALDEKGEKHPLIRRVSVVRHNNMDNIALFTEDCGRGIKGYWLTAKKDLHKATIGKAAWLTRGEYTWLFDLPFPAQDVPFAKVLKDSIAQDVEGGK